ncbi:hypothetical protein N9L19_01155 [bacterium]|nr:hypothetical protein [bacterium]
MSSDEPLAAPKELPKRFFTAKIKLKEAQKSSTKFVESSEKELKIKNVNVYETIAKPPRIIAFSSSAGQLEA